MKSSEWEKLTDEQRRFVHSSYEDLWAKLLEEMARNAERHPEMHLTWCLDLLEVKVNK